MRYTIDRDDGFTGRKSATIVNTGNRSEKYHADYRDSFDIVVHSGTAYGPVVGRVMYHSFESYTNVWYKDDAPVKMKRAGIFTSNHRVPMPASGTQEPLIWKGTQTVGSFFRGGSMKLADNSGRILAIYERLSYGGFGPGHDGVLTLKSPGISQELKEQIIVSMLAVTEKVRKERQRAAAS